MRVLNVKLPNGDLVSAPFEEWCAALLFSLPPEALAKVIERLQMVKSAGSWQIPGQALAETPRHVIMKADPGVLGARLRG